MIKLFIDGAAVEVPEGTTVLGTASLSGGVATRSWNSKRSAACIQDVEAIGATMALDSIRSTRGATRRTACSVPAAAQTHWYWARSWSITTRTSRPKPNGGMPPIA